ncbi:MAG: hypothetical protein AAFY47_11840 [Pseudomonadota bacterium]
MSDLPDVKGVIEYLTREALPRRVFRHLRPNIEAPTTPTELAGGQKEPKVHFKIKQHSMQGWYTNGIPQDRLDLLAQWYGFESTIWKAWQAGNLGVFKAAYTTHWDNELAGVTQPRAPLQASGPTLRRIHTGKDDQPVESLGAIDVAASGQLIENQDGSFSALVICRPAMVSSIRLAVKFAKIRLTRLTTDTADELCASDRLKLQTLSNDREIAVELRPVGSGRPPTFELQADQGAIELVSLPDDLWKWPNLKAGDRFMAELIVLLRNCTGYDDGDEVEDLDEDASETWDDGNSFFRPRRRSLGNRALEAIHQRYEQLRLSDGDEDWAVLHRTRFILEVSQ